MSEITFKDLGLEPKIKYTEVKIGEDKILSVVNYLPITDKTNLITFVADLAIDEMSGKSRNLFCYCYLQMVW